MARSQSSQIQGAIPPLEIYFKLGPSRSFLHGQYNQKKVSNSSIFDFTIINNFKAFIHPPNAPRIVEVIWQPPLKGWLNCNSDNSFSFSLASCGSLFRGFNGEFLFGFVGLVDDSSFFHEQLWGFIHAIDIAHRSNQKYAQFKTHSIFLLLAFKDPSPLLWKVHNIWLCCKIKPMSLIFLVSHIFQQGNQCAEKLALVGLSRRIFHVWDKDPLSSSFAHTQQT